VRQFSAARLEMLQQSKAPPRPTLGWDRFGDFLWLLLQDWRRVRLGRGSAVVAAAGAGADSLAVRAAVGSVAAAFAELAQSAARDSHVGPPLLLRQIAAEDAGLERRLAVARPCTELLVSAAASGALVQIAAAAVAAVFAKVLAVATALVEDSSSRALAQALVPGAVVATFAVAVATAVAALSGRSPQRRPRHCCCYYSGAAAVSAAHSQQMRRLAHPVAVLFPALLPFGYFAAVSAPPVQAVAAASAASLAVAAALVEDLGASALFEQPLATRLVLAATPQEHAAATDKTRS